MASRLLDANDLEQGRWDFGRRCGAWGAEAAGVAAREFADGTDGAPAYTSAHTDTGKGLGVASQLLDD